MQKNKPGKLPWFSGFFARIILHMPNMYIPIMQLTVILRILTRAPFL